MKYAPIHNRIVRGERVHETADERYTKLILEKKAPEKISLKLSIGNIETEFLIPKIESFIETEQVSKLKARVRLWVKAGFP
ncbi:hypothetical protein IMZ68_04645, partial [Candidatus Bathyarchaeota archaeon]|nr:hypothetical protein [Candidatus Bathyarchaeota archaeon]